MQHTRDPAAPHRAAPFLARLVACGLLGRAEALAALLQAAAPARVSACGRQARLTHALDNATAHNQSGRAPAGRGEAAQAARTALAPLLEANSPRRQLAAAAARAAGPSLQPDEIQALITEALAGHLRTRRRA
jgi:hypothetical protein